MCWMFWWMEIGRGSLCQGSNLDAWLTPFLYQACIEWCSHTSACGEVCTEVRVGLHGWAFAGSCPVAYGHFV